MKHIIIGGVAGGATTAARIRRNDEKAEIILLEKGEYISYANCGLPYYIGGVIKEREKLFVQTPKSFGTRFKIDIRTQSEAVAINRRKKSVTVKTSDGKEYEESYDKLILSPGAVPVIPPFALSEGKLLPGVFVLRNVYDTDDIKQYIDKGNVRNAVVIGAGFIGLEMAENLHLVGAKVSIVEMADQVMPPIDFSLASIVHQHLLQKGTRLFLGETVEAIEKNQEGTLVVKFKSGNSVESDLVILSIGVRPETTLAKLAELEIGEARGIKVNEFLQTSDENIYAVGDAIEYPHPITGKPWLNYLAGPANRQGRIAADNMVYGNKIKYEGAIGTAIAKVFDMTVASTGLAAKKLKQEGIEYLSSTVHLGSHAGYYPNALQMSLKITFSPKDGKLYGGQAVGFEGVDKRVDQLALVIKNGGTIYDLLHVEHAYAPPFSSAKDPIAIAGYVAENILNGRCKPLNWRDYRDIDRTCVTLLDVRTRDENSLGSIPGSINIPVDELRERLSEVPNDKPIYVYCAVGLRGYLANRILTQNGFKNVYNLSGGYKTYSNATAKISNPIDPRVEASDTQRTEEAPKTVNAKATTIQVDACGMQCPGPILKMKQSIDSISIGERVEMVATDGGFARDAEAWARSTGNKVISSTSKDGKYTIVMEKGEPKELTVMTSHDGKNKTLILFSDDLDKALATFVLANGAAATGKKVTIFFTFWGLNAIKKVEKPKVQKDIFGKMFGMMLPSNSLKLKLSKMNMLGIGKKMMRHIMKTKGIASLESLRQQALDSGVEFIACQMSMDVMGVKREELLDEVTIGGVATYMERAEEANVNLFI